MKATTDNQRTAAGFTAVSNSTNTWTTLQSSSTTVLPAWCSTRSGRCARGPPRPLLAAAPARSSPCRPTSSSARAKDISPIPKTAAGSLPAATIRPRVSVRLRSTNSDARSDLCSTRRNYFATGPGSYRSAARAAFKELPTMDNNGQVSAIPVIWAANW